MIRQFRSAADQQEWLRMRRTLWPELAASAAREIEDAREWLARRDAVVFVFDRAIGDRLGGFLEIGERPFADGCDTHPVAFLEGWYVDSDLRGRGIGRALIVAGEDWAKSCGYREFASDALLDAVQSQAAHLQVGFTEVERAVRYKKRL